MNGAVLVTGATGKTGRSLVPLLEEAGLPVRAASRGGEPPFDWTRPDGWAAALDGVGAVYLVAPSGVDDAHLRMIELLRLAERTGGRRFVLLSMASLPSGGPAQGQVHRWLEENAGDWAVLCPSAFMQNFSEGPYLASIRDEGAIYSNTGAGRVPFISTVDIAAAAFAALTAASPPNRAFTLTGGESLSFDDAAGIIGRACGRHVEHRAITTEAMVEGLRRRGLPERTATFLAAGYATIAEGAQDRIAPDLPALIGRGAITFRAFAAANAGVWSKPA